MYMFLDFLFYGEYKFIKFWNKFGGTFHKKLITGWYLKNSLYSGEQMFYQIYT